MKFQRSVIDIFVRSVYLYDDKLDLIYNYKDGAKTVALEDIESLDLVGYASSKQEDSEFAVFFFFW